MKNPAKIMGLMKSVTGKLDQKMKSGDISKDEIMKEATDIMGKMKDMGGGDQFNDLMKNLTKGMGLGKNAKFNKGAFESMQKDMEKTEKLKERLRKKSSLEKINAKESVFKIENEEQQKTMTLNAEKAMAELEELIDNEENEKVKSTTTANKKNKKKKKKKN